MKEKLKQILSQYQKKKVVDEGLVEAAVLIPVFFKDGEYHILFTQRSEKVTYHKRQISFPGGARGEGDENLLDTALRESTEEIGLKAEDVEILGELDDIVTATTGFVISPFVAFIPYPYQFKKNYEEIDDILVIPISALLEKTNLREEYQVVNDKIVPAYFYQYRGQVVWGATARIVKRLLEVLQPETGNL